MSIIIRKGDYAEVLGDVKAALICTSPPYNIGSHSPAKTGQRKYGLFDPKSYRAIREYPDNYPEDAYQESQVRFLTWCSEHLGKGGVLAYNHKPRRKGGAMIHPMQWILQVPQLVLMEEIIWDRGSTHNHSDRLFWPHTERIYILRRKGDSYKLKNTRELDYRSDVWRIGRSPVNGHNAPFPHELVRALIKAYTLEGDVVCDPYLGSGTTALVAKEMGRAFYGAEVLDKYWKMAINVSGGSYDNVRTMGASRQAR